MLHPMEGESGPQVLPLNNLSNNGPPFFQHQFFPRSCEHVQGGKQVVSNRLSLSLDSSDGHWPPPVFEKQAESLELRDSESHRAGWDMSEWYWDSLFFRARPADRVSSESMTADNNAETSASKLDSGDGTSDLGLGSCSTREELQTDVLERANILGKAVCDRTKFGSMEDESSDDVGNLTLKLGGRSYSSLDDTASGSQNGKRCRVSSPGHQRPTCQVDGCQEDLSNAKDYHRRHKVCDMHSKAAKAPVARSMQRFCQQCSRFHPLQEFDEGKRSCRRRLAGHNRRRRKTQPDSAAARAFLLAQDCTSRTAGLLNLLNFISLLQEKPCERANGSLNDRDLIVEHLRKLAASSALSHNTSGAANLNNVVPEHGTHMRGQSNDLKFNDGHFDGRSTVGVHQQALPSPEQLLLALSSPDAETLAALLQTCLKGQTSLVSKTMQESILQHLLQTHLSNQFSVLAPAAENFNKQNLPTPIPKRTLDSIDLSQPSMKGSSSLQHRVSGMAAYLSPLEKSRQEGESASQNAYAKQPHLDFSRTASTNLNSMRSGSTLGANIELRRTATVSCTRAEERREAQASPFQNSYPVGNSQQRHNTNSLWSKTHSQCESHHDNSYANIQDRTGRISFKLFDRNPGDFPQLLRTQILEWLSHVPSEMESYIRPGCVILTLYLSMPEQRWKELSMDFRDSLKRLLKDSISDFWCKGRILVQMLHQNAYIVDGEIQDVQFFPPSKVEIIGLRPVAVIAGQPTNLVLRGRNLYETSLRILCAYQGRYGHRDSSWLMHDYQEKHTNCGKDSVEGEGHFEERKFTFVGGPCNAVGRCFIEIETQGHVGSFVPVIVADKAVCNELNMLEIEMESPCCLAEQNGDHLKEDNFVRHVRETDASNFLHDLGWIFQKSFWQMNGVLPEEALPFQSPGGVMKRLLTFAVERDWCAVVNKLLDILFNIKEGPVYVQIRDALQIIKEVNPLHKAVKRKYLPMVKFLLAYVPRVMSQTLENSSSIGISRARESELLMQFIRNNHFVFTPDMAGPAKLTPLHIAASMQDAEDMVDVLTSDPCKIGLSAWINAKDAAGHTPFDCALARGSFRYIQMVSGKLAKVENPLQVTIDIPESPALALLHQNTQPVALMQQDPQSEHTSNSANQNITTTAGASADLVADKGTLELTLWQRPYLEGPDVHRSHLNVKNCHQQSKRFSRYVGGMKGPMYRPFMLSMIAIAAVCVCVCLFWKSLPQIQNVLSPFVWESLDFGPR
ncbi:hypothetical protein O6H91_10G047100 [Diphasiastrum complanatum]|uniref:Uncharacterized protein n=4 Tax=Diphasiastrum complanatum TaxID=34168 RepID=A0ACC2CGN4_DIPCM|nr:hypothetical protein O6H91_10G047100 [Diphasiastrum complanatum]KAJ7541118.1 hypothetical protein O6H91_10G047100 [Diphasiastrum complanatum]KAJ7541119.1 hypothetical protein O6H91_10G047100 [Diphasiastrum complanatum]KAJ7541120.1 hypothetical protein O6H91_10G047100 [Diphasiastrum complanatum]